MHPTCGLRQVWAWIWAWIWVQRGGGGESFGGGFDGGLGGVGGGEGIADKEEREGRCTSIGPHPRTDLTPSVVNFVRCCLVTCTGAALATRDTGDENDKDEIWNQRGKCRLGCSSIFFDTTKLTGHSSHAVGIPHCIGMPSLHQPLKIPSDEKKVCVVHDMRYISA
jgi:hypothetical protein